MKNLLKSALVAVSLAFASVSHAVPIDVTAPTAQISTDGTAAVTAVGLAIIGLAAVSMTLRWVKATFF